MRALLLSSAAFALLAACGSDAPEAPEDEAPAGETLPQDADPADEADAMDEAGADGTATEDTASAAEAAYDIKAQRAKIARIEMNPDVSFLNEEEREVVNILIDAAEIMTDLYVRQIREGNQELRAEIARSDPENRGRLLDMYDLHLGAWDSLDEYHPFYGDEELPLGAGFYPEDMTREEFQTWVDEHPDQADAFTDPYTVIRRTDDGGLEAIPYSEFYAGKLSQAADLLRQAAETTSNESLKNYLNLRAEAFRTNDYFDSDMAWMDLEGTPIEVVIGPYEVYTDRLLGQKAAFEAFITVKDPEESAALDKYKAHLRDMEENLPVEDSYKNFQRGFESPIVVADQVHGGGDNVPGVQTIAFNLPNDERVREAKGAKKVILENVLGAKYDRILSPMADKVLVADQADLVSRVYMQRNTLFHELSHSLGPGTITLDGRETTVSAELKEVYSASEEAKADVMGVYNILYMMNEGELPEAERDELLATYFAGIFRAVRFGIDEAHGRGAALQYSYYKEKGAFEWVAEENRYRVDYDALEGAVTDLTGDLIRLQGDGDYDGMKAFFEQYARLDGNARAVLNSMGGIPVDIQPIYPDEI